MPDGRRKKAKQLANQNSMQIEEEMMEASVVTAENTTVKQSSEDQSNEDRNRNEAKTICECCCLYITDGQTDRWTDRHRQMDRS